MLRGNSKKIVAFILFFTPVAILIYAIVAYGLFFRFQEENNSIVISKYKKSVFDEQKKNIIYQLKFYQDTYSKHRQNIVSLIKTSPYHGNMGILLFDKNGKLLYANKDDIDIINAIKENLDKRNIQENNHLLYLAQNLGVQGYKVVAYIDKSIANKEISSLKKELKNNIRKSVLTSIIWLSLIWIVFTIISIIIAKRIYKKMKKYEKELKDSNDKVVFQSRQAMLGELLPMIAHQWRQPINKIASVLMRMRFEVGSSNPNVEVLDRQCQVIEDSVELMSNTIDDFRGFYRPKAEPDIVDISSLIRKSIYFLDELLAKKNINIETNLNTVNIRLHGNELMQVLINLIKNASDAIGEDGEIFISSKEKNGIVIIRVEDDGPGIPDDMLDKVFEPHFSTKETSMGLGLYMSKLIVEKHFNGHIEAYNTPRGAGFIIKLYKKD